MEIDHLAGGFDVNRAVILSGDCVVAAVGAAAQGAQAGERGGDRANGDGANGERIILWIRIVSGDEVNERGRRVFCGADAIVMGDRSVVDASDGDGGGEGRGVGIAIIDDP